MSSPLFYPMMALAVIILGLSKGGFAGVGMISTPLLALVVGPIEAAGLIFPILIVQDCVALWAYKHQWNTAIIRTMIPGAALGIALAYQVASTVSSAIVQVMLGVISLLFSLQRLIFHFQADDLGSGAAANKTLGVVSGFASGFTSTIAHAGPPPFQFYVLPQRLKRDEYIGTSIIFFAAVNFMKIPAFMALGQVNSHHLATAGVFIPLAILSSWAGVRLVKRFDPEQFNLIIVVLLALISLALIYEGLAGLGVYAALSRAFS